MLHGQNVTQRGSLGDCTLNVFMPRVCSSMLKHCLRCCLFTATRVFI